MPYSIIQTAVDKTLSSWRVSAALVFLTALLVYANSLQNGFVYDDSDYIVNSEVIKGYGNIPDLFFSEISISAGGQDTNYYRPIPLLFLMVDYSLFELDPWGYHLSYILLHAAAVAVVFLFARRLFEGVADDGERNLFALYAALVFATHPVNTEVVAWNGTGDMLIVIFTLLALGSYIDGRHARGSTFFFIAALSKETAMVLPILIVAWDLAFRRGSLLPVTKEKAAGAFKRYLPYALVGAFYMALRAFALGGVVPVNIHDYLTPLEVLINIPPLFAEYLWKLILPINLNATHTFFPVHSVLEPKALIGSATATLYILCIYFAYRKSGVLFFSLVVVAAPLLPALYIPGMSIHVMAERRLYMPSVGFSLILVSLLFSVAPLLFRKGGGRTIAAVAAIILVAVFSVATVKRNLVWKDNLTLWTDAAKKSPDDYIPRNNLAAAYYDAGMLEEALAQIMVASRLRPELPRTHNFIGLIYAKTGNDEAAATEFGKALKINGHYSNARFNLATLHLLRGRVQEAVTELKEVLSRDPSHFQSAYSLAVTYKEMGDGEEAAAWYQKALAIKPSSAEAHNNLGILYGESGRYEEAASEFEAALRYDPAFTDAAHNLNYTNKLMRGAGGG